MEQVVREAISLAIRTHEFHLALDAAIGSNPGFIAHQNSGAGAMD
jgi:hypothetical protein